ncbi:MAG: hypothetical protein JXR37_28510 [Kiritimatiellae bacterium]|nr:hypothetical protein [Kiritimatiellia bacterium]
MNDVLPVLYRKIAIPAAFLIDGPAGAYGGDIRLGDLTGDGRPDFLVYRTRHGTKPCFLGAFDIDGQVLWQSGAGGRQPVRPGPVAIHDIDGDGETEVVCFRQDPGVPSPSGEMRDVLVQVLDGRTGAVRNEARPPEIAACRGEGSDWVHQRILVADLRGSGAPRDFVVKLGDTVVAVNERIEVLWTYRSPWREYGRCPAYIPCVGDIDADGKDEVNGGYFLLDHDGTPLWERRLGDHMDSVAIAEWDDGRLRAFCSGFGHVVDHAGHVILKLGEELVPHGQELRVAHFDPSVPGPQMAIRYRGHTPHVLVAGRSGEVLSRFTLNESPNNTGMEAVYWHGPDAPALLFNGGVLWTGRGELYAELPGLPEPKGNPRQGWHHCIPARIHGGPGEDLVVYNPWDAAVYIFTRASDANAAADTFKAGPRQYNARLMD